jgi:hypothetical protein
MLIKANQSSSSDKSGIATLLYGKLGKDGFQNGKTIQVMYTPFETACSDGANSTFFIKDNYLITISGCPIILELTVFDLEK